MNSISIYNYIIQNMKDGQLERGFSLPAIEDGNEIRFMDGALDGIAYYHTQAEEIDTAGTEQMMKAIKFAGAGKTQDADEAFAELGRSFRAISNIDALQKMILKNTEELSADNVYQTALYLITQSKDRESVKFGLSMLELFETDEEPVKEVIRQIGLSDEFTIFSVWNMTNWDNANQEVFDLIQKVYGWGRILALEKLVPENDEISEWILLNGVDNDIMGSYSALASWKKASVEERLQSQPDKEEVRAIGRILRELLDEGPVPGISEIENAEEYIRKYLSLSEAFGLESEEGETVRALKQFLRQ